MDEDDKLLKLNFDDFINELRNELAVKILKERLKITLKNKSSSNYGCKSRER